MRTRKIEFVAFDKSGLMVGDILRFEQVLAGGSRLRDCDV